MASNEAFRPKDKDRPVDWGLATESLLDAFYEDTGPDEASVRTLEDATEKLLSMDIQEEAGVSAEENLDQTLRLAQLLQLALEHEMFIADGTEKELEDAMHQNRRLRNKVEDSQVEDMEQRTRELTDKWEEEKEKAAELERELALTKETLEEEQKRNARFDDLLKEEKKRAQDAVERARVAEEELANKEKEILREQKRASRNNTQTDSLSQELQERKRDNDRFNKENKVLERRLTEVEAQLKNERAMRIEVDEKLVTLHATSRQWSMREGELESQLESVERERQELQAQVDDLAAAVELKMNALNDFEAKFATMHADWQDLIQAKDEELLARDEEREKLVLQLRRLRGGVDDYPPVAISTTAMGGAGTSADEVERLRTELAAANNKVATLATAYDTLERDTAAEVEAAMEKQRVRLLRVEADNERLKAERKKQHEQQVMHDQTLTAAQEDLEEAERLLRQYEEGVFGMPEAMRDIKRLKRELRASDAQHQKNIRKMNEYVESIEGLSEQTAYLREQLGLSADAELDLGDFRMKRQVETQSLRALNAQLESEVRELEDERRRLKNELRYRAKWHGEAAAKLGLTAEQVLLLEEYRDELRYGDGDEMDHGDDPLVQAERQIQTLKAKLGDALLGQLGALTAKAREAPSPHSGGGDSGGGDDDSRMLADLQRQLSLARVDAATMQERALASEREREALEAVNRQLAERCASALEKLAAGNVPTETAMSTLNTALAALKQALQVPTGAPLPASKVSGSGSGAAASPELVGLLEALNTMQQQRDHWKAVAGGAAPAGAEPVASEVTAVAESLLSVARSAEGPAAAAVAAAAAEDESDAAHWLREQLLECLQEQARKEERLEALAAAEEKHAAALRESAAARAVLYREHVRLRDQWKLDKASLQKQVKDASSAAAAAEAARAEAARLAERLQGGTHAELKSALTKASNDLTLTQVREIRLARQLEAATTAEAALRAETADLMQELEDSGTAAARAVCAARAAAAAAEGRVQQLQRELDMGVRREEYDAVVEQSRQAQAALSRITVEATDAAVVELEARRLREEAARHADDNAALTDKLAAAEVKVAELERVGGLAGEEAMASLRAEVVQLRVDLAAAGRAKQAEAKAAAAAGTAAADAQESLAEVERQLAAVTLQLHATQEAEAGLLRAAANAATLEQYRVDATATEQLRSELAEATAAAAAAAAARDEAVAAAEKGRTDHMLSRMEVNGLREALRTLEAAGDARAALGRAHEATLQARMQHQRLVHRTARTEAENDRLERENARLQRAAAAREAAMVELQATTRAMLRQHEAALQRLDHLGLRGRAETRRAREWSRALLDQQARAKETSAELEAARAARHEAAARAEAAEARAAAATHAAGVARGQWTPTELQQHNIQLSEKALQANLARSKLERENVRLVENAAFLAKMDAEREAAVQRVEEEAARQREAAEAALDTEAKRVNKLQLELLEARRAAAAAAAANPAPEGANTETARVQRRLTGRQLITEDQPKLVAQIQADAACIEESKTALLAQLDTIESLKLKLADATSESASAKEAAHRATAERDAAMATCKDLQRRLGLMAGGGVGGGSGTSAEESALEQLREVAAAATKRLQAALDEKEMENASLQKQLQKVRADAVAQHRADLEEVAALNELVFTAGQQRIGALRAIPSMEGGGGGGGGGGEAAAAVGSYAELLGKLQARDQEMALLQNKQEQERTRTEAITVRLEELVAAKDHEIARLVEQVESERQMRPSAVMESLVGKLKAQLAAKDAKLGHLKEAIKQLESRLIDAFKSNAIDDIQGSQAKSVEAQAASAAEAVAAAEVSKVKLQTAKEQNAKMKQALATKQSQLDESSERIAGLEAEGRKRAADLQSAQKAAAALKESLTRKEAERLKLSSAVQRLEGHAEELKRELTMEQGKFKHHKTNVTRVEVSRAADGKDREDRCGQLEKQVARLEAQNQRLTALLRNEPIGLAHGDKKSSLEAGLEALDPARLRNLEIELAEKDACIVRLEATLANAARTSQEVAGVRIGWAQPTTEASAHRLNRVALTQNQLAKTKAGSLLTGNPALEKWEAGKQMQRKIDALKRRLDAATAATATAEAAAAKSEAKCLELRKERDRALAAAKSSSGRPEPDAKNKAAVAMEEEIRRLHASVAVAEAAASAAERKAQVDQPRRIKQLEAALAAAEERRGSGGGGGGMPAHPEEAAALAARVQELEAAALKQETTVLELRFEKEQASLQAARLEDRLQIFLSRPPSSGEAAAGGGKGHSGKSAAARVAELEDVVEALKRVVEKLKAENETLKKQSKTSKEWMTAVNKAKALSARVAQLEEEQETLTRSLERHQAAAAAAAAAPTKLARLEDANATLRTLLAAAEAAAAPSPPPPAAAAASAASSEEDVTLLREQVVTKTRVNAALQRQLEAADREVAELRMVVNRTRNESPQRRAAQQAAAAEVEAARAAAAAATKELQRCKAENRDLKNELNAFDPAFFDEIEDLKHSHHKLERACGAYEQQLQQYASRLGQTFTRLR